MSDEKRRFPRVAVESTNLRLATTQNTQANVRIDRLIDFSLGGLQVELAEGEAAPKLGSLLDINLDWTEGAQRFDASVRHVIADPGQRVRVGIEFDDPDLVEKLMGAWFKGQK